jgi:centrosomal CEP192-like protein/ASPM-SPD-2-Hydin domain-containing protein
VAFISDGANPTLNLPLSGTGLAPGSLSPNPASLDFGNVVVGDNRTLPETLTNASGADVTITQATASGTGFSLSGLSLPLTLPSGQSTNFNVTFAPQAVGSAGGNISIVSNASNSNLTIPLSGLAVTAGTLSANPTSLNFGNVTVGNNKTLPESITNTGGSDVVVSQHTLTGAGFSVTGPGLPLTLTPGQKVSFNVTFTPQSPGNVNGNLTVVSDASDPNLAIPLTAKGVAPGTLSANPTTLSFGNVKVGNNKSLPETLTNTGGSNVTISQDTIAGAGYSVSGLNLPVTLTPSQQVSFNVIFTPQSPGVVNGNLTIISDASNPSLVIPLSGTGVAPGTLSANPTSLSFGNVKVGNNKSLTEKLTNTGGSNVTISQDTITGAGYSVSGLNLPLTLTPSQQVTFNVIFTPQSTGVVNGNLTIISDASNPSLVIPLSGTGVAPGTLSANPTSLSFGNVQVGHNKSLPETLTNTGGSNVTISQDTITGAGYSVSGLNLPLTLTPSQQVTFNVIFTPQSTGVVNGNLTIVSDGSNPNLVIPVSGTGTPAGQLSVNPSSLNFGNVVVGSYSSLPATLNATGAAVTVTSGNSSSAEFTFSGLTFPFTIQAGNSKGFTVTFTPQANGVANATLTFNSDASNSPTVQSLTGTGIPPTQHQVVLSWNASDTQGVVGYNVYRGTASGGPYSKIDSLDPDTSYTDTNVANGTTYFYVTRAVDGGNQESVNSNEATAVIP